MKKILVGILMGSPSDLPVMAGAAKVLEELDVPCEVTVSSAHRTPDETAAYARSARRRGIRVLIAGAGGAAHLAGVVAAFTTLPVIGVPIKSSNSIDGWDSLLSMVQMPSGVPVATVAVDGATNAGLLAAQILGTADAKIAAKLEKYKAAQRQKVIKVAQELETIGYKNYVKKS